MPLVNGGGNLQAKLIQPVLTDKAAYGIAELILAADERECKVISVIRLDHLVNLRIFCQILFNVRAVLVKDIVQRNNYAVLDCLFRSAGILLHPLPFHNIRKASVRNNQVELFFFLSGCRMLEFYRNTGLLLPCLAQFCFS